MRTTGTMSSPPDAAPVSVSRRRRIGRRLLTALRVLLAIEFAGAGLMKLGAYDRRAEIRSLATRVPR